MIYCYKKFRLEKKERFWLKMLLKMSHKACLLWVFLLLLSAQRMNEKYWNKMEINWYYIRIMCMNIILNKVFHLEKNSKRVVRGCWRKKNDKSQFLFSFIADETGASIDKPMATLVYIHGESYEWNSGNLYDGTVMAAHSNIIVVTINFRLGILGT